MQHIPGLYIMHTESQGRGVFTAVDIKKGDLIEIAPVIVLKESELPVIHNTTLHDYYFLWGPNNETCAIALGYASMYNHAVHPNANYLLDLPQETIEVFAIEDIEAGSQITINYHGEPGDDEKLWF